MALQVNFDTILKLPQKQKIALLVAVILIMVGLYIYLSVMPSLSALDDKQEELAKKQKELLELKKVVADLPRFEKELQQIEAQFKEALTLLPNTREIPSLLTNISNLARDCGLEILLFQPKPEVMENFYAQIPVEMKILGKYHDLGVFFDRVSKLPRIVNILDITMDRKAVQSKSGADPGTLNASFKAVTYKFVEVKQDSDKKQKGKKKT
ncbi:MAG: type 4a pilus biogenesis protein PilO [Proteobacteria bacterium]|nr:type 4a pilus biogenesis protein PilO [Pseudomonadota bacterium]